MPLVPLPMLYVFPRQFLWKEAGMMMTFMFPKTVKEAVALILLGMPDRDKLIVRNTKKKDLDKFHSTWGREIRLLCGLWAGNQTLLKDANAIHPDSASTVIMEAVWEELQKE